MTQDRIYYLMHKRALGQTSGPYTMPEAESHADHDPDAYTLLREVRWDENEKPAEYLGTTADGGEEFRVSWADERGDPQGKDGTDDREVKRLMGIPQYGEEQ